jgi:ribosomal protein L37AE/L43A
MGTGDEIMPRCPKCKTPTYKWGGFWHCSRCGGAFILKLLKGLVLLNG